MPTENTEIKQEERANTRSYGEYIGGSKADLWQIRNFDLASIQAMTPEDKQKLITKNNIWPTPDYDKLVNELGYDVLAAEYIRDVRNSLATKPIIYFDTDKDTAAYVEFVNDVRDVVMGVKSKDDFKGIIEKFIQKGYIDLSGKSLTNKLDSSRYLRENHLNRRLFSPNAISLAKLAEKNQTGKAEKMPKGYQARKDGSGQYVLIKGYSLLGNFDTYEQAREEALKLSKKKTMYVPPELKDIHRIGPDIRNGKDITDEDMLSRYKLYGSEYGNWVEDKLAKGFLNNTYDSFNDLADALKIKPEQISLNGKLAIGFGSRGRGRAAAHYEPGRQVINLTKKHGAGSLAHEMMHAFDDLIGKKLGLDGMLSEHQRAVIPESFKHILDVMKYRPATEEEKKEIEEKHASSVRIYNERLRQTISGAFPKWHLSEDKAKTMQETVEAFIQARGEFSFQDMETKMNPLQELHRDLYGISIDEDLAHDIYMAKAVQIHHLDRIDAMKEKVETDFYKGSMQFDVAYSKDAHGYWASDCEMFARAGACYITDKLREMGRRNDFLSGSSEIPSIELNGKKYFAIPKGEEREKINQAIDDFFRDMREQDILVGKEEVEPTKENETRTEPEEVSQPSITTGEEQIPVPLPEQPAVPSESIAEKLTIDTSSSYNLIKTGQENFDKICSDEYYLPYLDLVAKFPQTSPLNVALIMAQNPEASYMKTYAGWQKEGNSVRKGEHGTKIISAYSYPKFNPETGDTEEKTGYKISALFDMTQVNQEVNFAKPECDDKAFESALEDLSAHTDLNPFEKESAKYILHSHYGRSYFLGYDHSMDDMSVKDKIQSIKHIKDTSYELIQEIEKNKGLSIVHTQDEPER